MYNKHVTISNCNRLHQFPTNHKFQVPAIFNTYPIFPTAIFHVPRVYNVCTRREKIGKFCIKQIHDFDSLMTPKTKFSFQIIGHESYCDTSIYIIQENSFNLEPTRPDSYQIMTYSRQPDSIYPEPSLYHSYLVCTPYQRGMAFGYLLQLFIHGYQGTLPCFPGSSVSKWDAEGPGYSIRRLHS